MDELANERGVVVRSDVTDLASRGPLVGRRPDHNLTIQFCKELGFIHATTTRLTLKQRGRVFLSLRDPGSYDLSAAQQDYLLEAYFFAGPFFRKTRALLEAFGQAPQAKTFRWNRLDSTPIGDREDVLEALHELRVLDRNGDTYDVRPEHLDAVGAIRAMHLGQTLEDFLDTLAERKRLGALAELAALAFERERLRKAGYPVEAECIQHVSKLENSAGYDIASYDGKRQHLRGHDRFIEVKGAKGDQVNFIWSVNEQHAAKKLGESYWIYFVGRIDTRRKTTGCEVLTIQDPYKKIHAGTPYSIAVHQHVVNSRTKARGLPAPQKISS